MKISLEPIEFYKETFMVFSCLSTRTQFIPVSAFPIKLPFTGESSLIVKLIFYSTIEFLCWSTISLSQLCNQMQRNGVICNDHTLWQFDGAQCLIERVRHYTECSVGTGAPISQIWGVAEGLPGERFLALSRLIWHGLISSRRQDLARRLSRFRIQLPSRGLCRDKWQRSEITPRRSSTRISPSIDRFQFESSLREPHRCTTRTEYELFCIYLRISN